MRNPSTPASAGSDGPGRAFTWMVLGVCVLLLSPTLAYRIGVDQGVFAYMGDELLQGRWPYIDTWESDFPGMMLLQALEILVFGKSVAMFRLFDLLVQLINVFLIYRITGRLASRTAGYVAAAIYVLIYQGYGPWNTAQREGFALPFLLVGLWLLLTAQRRPRAVTAAAIGMGVSIAVTFKPSLLFPLSRTGLRLLLIGGAASAVPLAAVVVFYAAQGELRALYEACIAYQGVYTERLRGDDPLWRFWMGKLGRLGGTTIGLIVAYLPFLWIGARLRERRLLYLGFLGSVYSVFLQGTFAGYHYLPGMALGAIMMGTMFHLVSEAVLGGRHGPVMLECEIRSP